VQSLSEALLKMGATPAVLQAIQAAKPEQGRKLLEELKKTAKSRYKRLLFELHPDRNQGLPNASATFAILSEAYLKIDEMAVEVPVEPRARPVVLNQSPAPRRTSIYATAVSTLGSRSPRRGTNPLKVVSLRPT
jgi:hypothetical protein